MMQTCHNKPSNWVNEPRPRPSIRRNVTCAFRVGGHKLHLTIGLYEDDAPMELFIDVAKEGSTTRALLDAIARQVSRGWQRGVPAAETVDQFVNTRFEPSGKGEGHPAVEGRQCTSLLDAIARVVAHELGVEVNEEVEI